MSEESMEDLVRECNIILNHTPLPGRNEPCPCGSGKKYKKCHGPIDEAGTPCDPSFWEEPSQNGSEEEIV